MDGWINEWLDTWKDGYEKVIDTEEKRRYEFIISSKRIKHLGINLLQEAKTCTQKTITH